MRIWLFAAFLAMIIPGQKQETIPVQFASDMQMAAWRYGPKPQLLSGGWSAGKSWLGAKKAIYLSTRYKRNRGVIIRHKAKDLRATSMATFYKLCPGRLYAQRHGGRRNDQSGYMRFIDDYASEVMFIHLEDPDTASIVRGLEINWFLWEQAEENPEHGEELFDMLMGRLGRWDMAEVPQEEIESHVAVRGNPWPYVHPESLKPLPPPYAMLNCNPDVETHWLYRRFHPDSPEHTQATGVREDGTPRPSYEAQGYKMFHMPSVDNRFLTSTNRDMLLNQDDSFIRRNVQGLWGQPEGAIHFVHASSVIPGTRALVEYLRRTCTLFRTMDYGDSAPTCVTWWAVDRNGNCYAWMEYYLENKPISTHRANITGLSGKDHYTLNLADPSIFHTMPAKQGGRFSVADEYADTKDLPRETAIFWAPADNNELGTRNRMNEYLRFEPTRMRPMFLPDGGTLGSARAFVLTSTPDWPQGIVWGLQQVRAARRVKIGTNLGKPQFSDERDPDIPDHALDTWRYFFASRPPAPPLELPAAAGTFLAARQQLRRQQRGVHVR